MKKGDVILTVFTERNATLPAAAAKLKAAVKVGKQAPPALPLVFGLSDKAGYRSWADYLKTQ